VHVAKAARAQALGLLDRPVKPGDDRLNEGKSL
jgi:hypothetical protein